MHRARKPSGGKSQKLQQQTSITLAQDPGKRLAGMHGQEATGHKALTCSDTLKRC